jgi:phosphoglycolate phosphatase-like HAD superfamily hydrolase
VDGPYPPKPRPAGLQALMARAAATPQETLLVGDSPIDLQTAHNANTHICVARYGYGFIEMAPSDLKGNELFINRPDQLPAVLGNTAMGV